jgi:hypothetical protein
MDHDVSRNNGGFMMKFRSTIGLAALVAGCAIFAISVAATAAKKTSVNGIAWHDSFEAAVTQAKKEDKPVLLMSMFGKINEDMPCANARTLRATLMNDPEFKDLVRDEVIPAWEMVRAVPKVEIDLGNGKKVKRTVRGNAVMYLCNADGKVIDAYPGVYTKDDFMPMIRESIRELAKADEERVLAFHKARGRMIPRSGVTTGKLMVEGPTLSLIGAPSVAGAATAEKTSDPARRMFLQAARNLTDASLTPMSSKEIVPLLTGKQLEDWDPAEVPGLILKNDSRLNMERMRPVIHLWLASEKKLPTPAEARDTVLETILKIPYKDPYFGLRDVLLPGTPG